MRAGQGFTSIPFYLFSIFGEYKAIRFSPDEFFGALSGKKCHHGAYNLKNAILRNIDARERIFPDLLINFFTYHLLAFLK